jgi:hypothetical protein
VPLAEAIYDTAYLKYSECCCCGEYPPPENGFMLKQYKNDTYIQYPICDRCEEDGKEPDTERIMRMYAGYAINLEQMIDRI